MNHLCFLAAAALTVAALAAQGAGANGGGTAAAPALPDLGAPASPPDGAPPHVARIERAGLRTHAYWLADDARAGRYTTSAGQQATAKYVADHWKKLGLVFRPQDVSGRPWMREFAQGPATLVFDDRDELVDFWSDDRPEASGGRLVPRRWSTPVSEYRDVDGFHRIHRGRAVYARPEGPFTYGVLTIRSIEYDVAPPSRG